MLVIAGLLLICVALNVLIIEIKVQRMFSSVSLRMTNKQVISVLGKPSITGSSAPYPNEQAVPETTFFEYQYPYPWHYITLLWSHERLNFNHGKLIKVEFNQSGTVSSVSIWRPYDGISRMVKHK